MLSIDHLVIVAETLDAGRDHVENALNVTMQPGGQHAHFGTHNLLLGLEDGLYLEVISIDPAAQPPAWPRWFGLDSFTGAPRLAHWVARSTVLERDLAQAYGGQVHPLPLQRGDLSWRMGIPQDGNLPLGGLFPGMIDWGDTEPPAGRLTPTGCKLSQLVLGHPDPAGMTRTFAPFLADDRVVLDQSPDPVLRAVISTPQGEVTLW